MAKRRLYNKYHIEKVDGTPLDPFAEYFVLRLDKDPHARKALRAYISSVQSEDPEFAKDLDVWMYKIEKTWGKNWRST